MGNLFLEILILALYSLQQPYINQIKYFQSNLKARLGLNKNLLETI